MTSTATETADVPAHRTVFELFADVKRAVGPVGKESRNTQQNYDYRGIDAVVNAAAVHLDEHGVINVPTLLDETYATVEVGKNRTPMAHVRVKVRYTFYGPRGDSFAAEVPGEAMDSGDKATPKAMSVAWRIALLQCLNLPTSDPDPDSQSYQRSDAMPDSVPDDGDWYGWRERIDALTTTEQSLALDKDIRAAYFDDDGNLRGQAEKATNVKKYFEAKVSELHQAKQAAAKQDASWEEVPAAGTATALTADDPVLANLLLRCADATTVDKLAQVRVDAQTAGKFMAPVPDGKGGNQPFSMTLRARKTELENAAASEKVFADANAGVAAS